MRPALFTLLPCFAVAACATVAPTTAPTPTTALGTACPPAAADNPEVARIGERSIRLAEIDGAVAADLYELRERAVDRMVAELVLEQAAKRAGVTPEEFLHKEIAARVPEVSDAEAKEFLEHNRDRLPERFQGKSFAELKPMIVEGLTGKKRELAVAAFVDELKAKAGAKILLAPPTVAVAATGPARGPTGAKVTIIEFSDFQCPYCARGKAVMDQVMKAYGGDVRLVFRDFPLSFHEHAERAAEAGQCAAEQGKFWEMHDWMFDHQDALTLADLVAAAKTIGLDGKKFEPCLQSGKYAGAVAANQRDGEKAGVKGTPAFFVNGRFLSGALPFEKFKTEIDRELGR